MDWSADINGLVQIGIAAALGALVGLEREIAGKPAGLKTHIFVAAGSALLMLLSRLVLDDFQSREGVDVVRTDPVRVIQAIVVGISFLGAGTIVHERGRNVEGLTTAASIYLTAGIGIATALRHTGLAVAVTLGAVGIQLLVGFAEDHLRRRFDSGEPASDDSARDR